ncbi:hypothetical protein LQK89_02770 [Curtobacterium sp. C1]|uniref:hypothetical protein n=1 Tax=Curtobacterium sp. C1 TaxID=2898151 RepID=UPI001E473F7F|nr:hypothetical protein [Curtobacterium sp. C1]UFU14642.1 hypothetical protein LQK89_02770 [Curtobacterium sp. C1]
MTDEVFTVKAYDLNTNAFICELPANGLRFDRRLNDHGSISFDVDLKAPGTAAIANPFLQYAGNPVALYVDRSGILVWGGISETVAYKKSTGLLSVGGKEFLAYFESRLALRDYSQKSYPNGVDPAILLGTVLTDTQNPAYGGPGASIGLSVVSAPSNLPMLTPGYPLSQPTMVGTIVSDLVTTLTPGYGTLDWQLVVAYDTNGNPTRTAYVRAPRSGRGAGSTGLMFDLSNCVEYSWPIDNGPSGNVITVTGAGNGSARPLATVVAPFAVGGLGQPPRMDYVFSSSAQSQQQVQQMANGLSSQCSQPLMTPVVTVPTSGAQPLGSWILGDDARLVTAGDEFFPNGLDQYWRIVQESVDVPDAGVPTVELTFNLPPTY